MFGTYLQLIFLLHDPGHYLDPHPDHRETRIHIQIKEKIRIRIQIKEKSQIRIQKKRKFGSASKLMRKVGSASGEFQIRDSESNVLHKFYLINSTGTFNVEATITIQDE